MLTRIFLAQTLGILNTTQFKEFPLYVVGTSCALALMSMHFFSQADHFVRATLAMFVATELEPAFLSTRLPIPS